ncbi:hypothetical protein [Streptomyces sp. NPDC002328]|uniref:hypothetical protein n=1 Tax=Streptomyces sp. NPDC002328 TaxID=3364642 RepID=UPI0036C88A27
MTVAVSYLLQLPTAPPSPVPGCTTCAALAEKRAAAQAKGDYSKVSDCNVRMRRHHKHRAATAR